jgi:hypothetical protein
VELKNAVAVCLISLFSATLVVLIARSLDSRAAARLEPQLARIADHLEAIRADGAIGASESNAETAAPETSVIDDGLMVYYLHGQRCPTCRAAEENAHAALTSAHADDLAAGRIGWEVLDYLNDSRGSELGRRFGVVTATLVLARMADGEIEQWNRLDRTLALADDRAGMARYLQTEIDTMLADDDPAADAPNPAEPDPVEDDASTPDATKAGPPAIPLPE